MPKEASTKNDDWVVAKDHSLLDTARLYESEASSKCGHALNLQPLMDYLEKKSSCPICQTTVEVVCDGMTSNSKMEEKQQQPTRIVAFKYRKHLYRLSVIDSQESSLAFPYSLCFWMWRRFLVIAGEDDTFTAQDRIAQVLRMDLHGGMRVRKQ